MGLKIERAKRVEFFSKFILPNLDGPKKVKFMDQSNGSSAVIADGNAFFRAKNCSNIKRTAKAFALLVSRCLWDSLGKNGGMIFVLFDTSDFVHPERIKLWQRRYKKCSTEDLDAKRRQGYAIVGNEPFKQEDVPYTAEEIEKFDIDTPIFWHRMWSSVSGKQISWNLLQQALFFVHKKHCLSAGVAFVCWLNGRCQTWPSRKFSKGTFCQTIVLNLEKETTCEADRRVQAAVELCLKHGQFDGILVRTSDTDMIGQLMCSKPGLNCKLHLQLRTERMDVGAIWKHNHLNRSRMASQVFWILACGGGDYCTNLIGFGFSSKALFSLARSVYFLNVVKVVKQGIAFYCHEIVAGLQSICSKASRAGFTNEEFVKKINAICFTVALFCGAKKHRACYGGPDMPEIYWLKTDNDCKSQFDLAHVDKKMRRCLFISK